MTSFMFALHLFYSSMGCGIGYGYLHRIPIKDPSELPPQLKASPAPDGFSDVSQLGFRFTKFRVVFEKLK